MITTHKNSILNPNEVKNWAYAEFSEYNYGRFCRIISDRINRAKALLPNVKQYCTEKEYNRALSAVDLWVSEFEFYKMPF